MSLEKVIEPHYGDFCDLVSSPLALASHLNGLTRTDREDIACQSRHFNAVMELHKAICGKVEWKDLYEALMKENYFRLATILEEEYYRQNPGVKRILYNRNPETQMPTRAEHNSENSSSNDLPSSRIHLRNEVDFNNCSCNKDSTSSKSKPPASGNNFIIHGNCFVVIGDHNNVSSQNDRPEQNPNENDTEYEIVSEENLVSQNHPEIDVRTSPVSQKISDGYSANQSVTNDACMTNNLVSKDNSFRNHSQQRNGNNCSETLLKTLAGSEQECNHQNEEMTAVNNNASSATCKHTICPRNCTNAVEKLGIELRKKIGKNEGEDNVDDDEEETLVKRPVD